MKMKIYKMISLYCFICLSLALPNVAKAANFAPEEIGVSYGHGIDVKHWLQIELIQHVIPPLHILEEYLHEPFLDIGIAKSWWDRSNETAYHLSANLMLRSQNINTKAGNIFFEAGFGPHLFSRPGETNRLDTAFEFNSFVGVGIELNKEWSFIARARHLSNAGITDSNAGVNLFLYQLHYKFNQP